MIAVNEACKQPENQAVKVEGYFRLSQTPGEPFASESNSPNYILLLVEKVNGTGAFVTAIVPVTNSRERNHMDTLPASYTYNDLHINTDSGKQVSAGDKVALTARIAKDSRSCVLNVEKIETP